MSIIKENRLKLGLTMAELAKKVGVSEGTISRWESGDIANMKQNNIISVSKALDISPLDLLEFDTVEQTKKNGFAYKLFPCSISAGALELIEGVTDYKLITIADTIMGKYAGKKDIILLKVNGDSMDKVIPNGSLIIVDTSKKKLDDIHNGDIVVFSNNGEYSVKRFFNDKYNKRLLFKPDSYNELFTTIEIRYELALDVRLIGKVVKYIVNLD